MDWNDLRIFLALARHGSVRAAAAKLDVSHSTVARRTELLEKQLGARLFDRLPSGYAITAAGEDVRGIAEEVERDLDGLERQMLGRDQRLAGSIQLTTVDFLGTHLLMPLLADFTRRYPEIDLGVVATYEVLDISRREADVALRFTDKPPEHLVGRPLATVGTAAYATPGYLERHGLGANSTACWIGYTRLRAERGWVQHTAYPHLPARGHIESVLLQFEAAKAGMGIGMLPCIVGDSEPLLRRLPESRPGPSFELWLLTHRDVRKTARLRVFTEYLSEAVIRERDRLAGRGVPPQPASPAKKAKPGR